MRRGTIEILRDILAVGKCSTNEAIYKVGLNPPQFNRYRTLLLKGGFIRRLPPEDGRRLKLYEPTQRGLELQTRIDRVMELLPHRQSEQASSSLGQSGMAPTPVQQGDRNRETAFAGQRSTVAPQPQSGNGAGG